MGLCYLSALLLKSQILDAHAFRKCLQEEEGTVQLDYTLFSLYGSGEQFFLCSIDKRRNQNFSASRP